MEPIKLDCTYEERTSHKKDKQGVTFKAIIIKFPNGYERIVFPTAPEQYLIEHYDSSKSASSPYDF